MDLRSGREWFVSGAVQGVGYRFFVQREAASLGLTGWARNLEDGRVQVHACGPADRLDDLERALHTGPRAAHVQQVEVKVVPCSESNSFEIR